jgi:hypothetical protein
VGGWVQMGVLLGVWVSLRGERRVSRGSGWAGGRGRAWRRALVPPWGPPVWEGSSTSGMIRQLEGWVYSVASTVHGTARLQQVALSFV